MPIGPFHLLLAATLCLVAVASASEPDPLIQRVTVSMVGALTGPDAADSMREVDVCGTDIGTMAELDGRIYFAFGDTFGYDGDACPRHGPNWRSNVLAASSDSDPSDGIAFDWWLTDGRGRAIAVTEGAKQRAFTEPVGEQTRIPTAMVSVGGRLYLHFMSVHGFAAQGGVWTCNFSRFLFSDDAGSSWREAPDVFGRRDADINMLALTNERGAGNESGEYVYALATPCGRFGGARVARVEADAVLDRAAWQFAASVSQDGVPSWSPDADAAAVIVPAPVGEASLLWNPYLERWLYSYLNEHTRSLELREAPYPWGPWSAAHTLATAGEYPMLYGAFMTPSYLQDEGRTLYFVMSMFGPYNTFIMEATLDW
jgi:hypothetical protein